MCELVSALAACAFHYSIHRIPMWKTNLWTWPTNGQIANSPNRQIALSSVNQWPSKWMSVPANKFHIHVCKSIKRNTTSQEQIANSLCYTAEKHKKKSNGKNISKQRIACGERKVIKYTNRQAQFKPHTHTHLHINIQRKKPPKAMLAMHMRKAIEICVAYFHLN